MQSREKLLLVDIDGTLAHFKQSQKGSGIYWYGGGPEIWKFGFAGLRKLGFRTGLASFKNEKDFIAEAVEKALIADLDPEHCYYDSEHSGCKVSFALAKAAKRFGKANVSLLDDQALLVADVLEKGYLAFQFVDLESTLTSPNPELRQRLAIIMAFEQVVSAYGYAPLPEFSQMRRSLGVLLASAEGYEECLQGILEEKGEGCSREVKETALMVANANGHMNCAMMLYTSLQANEGAEHSLSEPNVQMQLLDIKENEERTNEEKSKSSKRSKAGSPGPNTSSFQFNSKSVQTLSFTSEMNRKKSPEPHYDKPKRNSTKSPGPTI